MQVIKCLNSEVKEVAMSWTGEDETYKFVSFRYRNYLHVHFIRKTKILASYRIASDMNSGSSRFESPSGHRLL
jgi:hypothetical protein